MKNAMKKLMSLVLIAVLLVSAVPFQASATSYALSINVDNDQKLLTEGTAASYADCLAAGGVDTSKVVVTNALYQYTTDEGVVEHSFGPGDVITLVADTRVYIFTKPIETTPPETQPEETEPSVAYLHVYVNGTLKYDTVGTPNSNQSINECASAAGISMENVTAVSIDNNNGATQKAASDIFTLGATGSITNVRFTVSVPAADNNDNNDDDLDDYVKFSNRVWLYIYTGTAIGSESKRIDITDGIAADGTVTLNEVKSLVKYYYNAVDADTGITFDGIYPMQGGWVYDYVADNKYSTIEGLYEAAAKQTVVLRVMIGNAKPASSGNADTTNPKTGDEIYMAMAVMAVSASVLALGFYFSKKRAY